MSGGGGRWGRAGGGLGVLLRRFIGRYGRGGNPPVAQSRANFCRESRPGGGGGGIGFIQTTWFEKRSSEIADLKRVLASADRALQSQTHKEIDGFVAREIETHKEVDGFAAPNMGEIKSGLMMPTEISSESEESRWFQMIEAWCRRCTAKKAGILDIIHASCGDLYEGTLNNETLGYYVRRVYSLPTCLGIDNGRWHFRQHLRSEMTHYATDCWNPKMECSYGWRDSADILDTYGLKAHIEKSGGPSVSHGKFSKPREIKKLVIVPSKNDLGLALKVTQKMIESLEAMSERAAMEIMAYAKPHKKKKSKQKDIVLGETNKEKAISSSHGSSSGNTATVCLDGDGKKCLESCREGIRTLRTWCRNNGTHVDVSSLYGDGREMFTTPGNGTFYLTLQYRERSITLNIYGKDLYIVGWTGGLHGGFEMLPGGCMCPQGQQMLPFKGNYSQMLRPQFARIGLQALRDSFDAMYKWDGSDSTSLKKAVTVMCVHFSESARLQYVLKFICNWFLVDHTVRLDSTAQFWVENYGHYTKECMKIISQMLSGTRPDPIKNRDGGDLKSPDEILEEIRICNRHGWRSGIFAKQVDDESPGSVTSGKDGGLAPPADLLADWVSEEKSRKEN